MREHLQHLLMAAFLSALASSSPRCFFSCSICHLATQAEQQLKFTDACCSASSASTDYFFGFVILGPLPRIPHMSQCESSAIIAP